MAISYVIESEVPRNPEHPGPAAHVGRFRDAGARNSKRHFLGQILGSVRTPDDPAQVPEDPVSMIGVELFDVTHATRL
jgi:hypothetical protein